MTQDELDQLYAYFVNSNSDAGDAAPSIANSLMIQQYGPNWRTAGTQTTTTPPPSPLYGNTGRTRADLLTGFVYNPDSPYSRQQQEEIYIQIVLAGQNRGGEPPPQAPQPLSPLSLQAIERINSLTPVDTQRIFAGAQDPGPNKFAEFIMPRSAASLASYLSGERSSSPYLEDFYRTNIQNPLVGQFTNETIPGLMGNYAKKGLLYGSGREAGRQKESANLMNALTKGRSDLLYNMWNQAQVNELNANNMATSAALGAYNADTARYGANINKATGMAGVESENRNRFLQAAGMLNATGMAEMAERVRVSPVRPFEMGDREYLLNLLKLSTNYEPTQIAKPDTTGQIVGSLIGGASAAAAAAAAST
jgi:hypothetical protein